MFKQLILFLSIISFATNVYSQESINSASGKIKNKIGEVNYSIGQLFFQTSKNIFLHEGVQINFTKIKEDVITEKVINIFPNPIKNKITLKTNNIIYDNYIINNIDGTIAMKGKITQEKTKIETSNLRQGYYLISITKKNGKGKKTFKIIKN